MKKSKPSRVCTMVLIFGFGTIRHRFQKLNINHRTGAKRRWSGVYILKRLKGLEKGFH